MHTPSWGVSLPLRSCLQLPAYTHREAVRHGPQRGALPPTQEAQTEFQDAGALSHDGKGIW